jgi:hypothetical protein
VSRIIKTTRKGSINPYDGRHSKFFAKLIDKVGDMKEDEQLQIKISSWSKVTRAKIRIRTAYPEVADRLEIFGRTLTKGRYLFIRWKEDEE